ncbi:MAG: hypothetical protein KA754_01075 [Corallincola sp.]|nr:hypothetical protein [Corallincola sp.]
MRATISSLDQIDFSHLKIDEREVCSLNYQMFPNKHNKIFIKGKHLAFHSCFLSPFKEQWRQTQSEYPLEALGWIIDSFVNKLWNESGAVDLMSESLSLEEVFDGERVGISPMVHCCAENIFGYNIWNASRKCHIAGLPPQNWHIPRYMLQDEGVIEQLQQINADYLAGKFDDLARS